VFFDYSNYYYLIIGLQAFCLFHAYKNRTNQKWYYLIIFLPVIGGLIYLYENFYSRRNVSNLQEGFKGLIYNNYEVEKLEKAVKFSESFNNKVKLGDAYTERGRYEEAIKLFESCRKGIYENNSELFQKLANTYFLNKDYSKIVELSKQVTFIGEAKIAFAWALHYTGDSLKAETVFKEMERRFSNYEARLEYSKFLIEINRSNDARNLLENILDEFDSSHNYEKNLKKVVVKEVNRLLKMIKQV
jgi:hypothetical protein